MSKDSELIAKLFVTTICNVVNFEKSVRAVKYKEDEKSNIQQKLDITTKALRKIEEIAGELIAHTPEYDNCYYKDKCGRFCIPKIQGKVKYCKYENVDRILSIIEGAKK